MQRILFDSRRPSGSPGVWSSDSTCTVWSLLHFGGSRNGHFVFAIACILMQIGFAAQSVQAQRITAAQFNELRFGTRAPYRDELVKSQAYMKNARQLRNENVVMQQRDFSCGAAALATVVNYYWGDNVSETALLLIIAKILSREELEDRVLNGLTLTDLKNVAQVGGYTAVLGKLTTEKLAESKLPLVVAITVNDYDHFVVFRGMDDEYVYLADPIYGKKKVLIEEFEEQWQQNAILAVIKPGEPPREDSPLLVKQVEKEGHLQRKQFIQFQLTGRVNP